jgi:hypothetical protein
MNLLQKLITIIAILIFTTIIFGCKSDEQRSSNPSLNKGETQPISTSGTPRESITFILGEDDDLENPYYTKAANYYRYNHVGKTDRLNTSCRSLLETRNFLQNNPPQNGQPWGIINMVVHANEWTGIGIPVLPDSKWKASAGVINSLVESGDFPSLENDLVDAQTELIIHGCGLGKNKDVLKAMAVAFGGKDDFRPIVRSSRYFVYYESDDYDPQNCNRYLAESWNAYFPTGKFPGEIKLARKLTAAYPDSKINWRNALSKTVPQFSGDAFQHSFKIPIIWYVTYPDAASRPELKTEEQKMAWLGEQQELHEVIKNNGFTKADFSWTIRKATYEFDDGTEEPAVKAIGLCTIVSVLKVLTEEEEGNLENSKPLTPEVTDERFYTVIFPPIKDEEEL